MNNLPVGVMNALALRIQNAPTRRALRKTSKGLHNRISAQSAAFKVKKGKVDTLKMLSNSNINTRNPRYPFQVMERLPLYKYTGVDPRNYNNNIGTNQNGIWTKKQWSVYLALRLYKIAKNQNSSNILNSWIITKGLRFINSPAKQRQIINRIENLPNGKISFMNTINIMELFTKQQLMNIGY